MEDRLISAIVDLNEEEVINIIKQALKNNKDPVVLLDQVRTGMKIVGARYEEGRYFIADLIMSGLIFNEIFKLVHFSTENTAEFAGLVVIFATVEQDIHDVGKNVTISFLKSRGINVIDLGVDVPAAKIVKEIQKSNASILCLSGLITSSYKSMKKTVDLLKKKQLHQKVKVIIGGNVDEDVKEYVGADYWTSDFSQALDIFKAAVSKNTEQS
ncbi:MAG: cobalamin-dependent protein [Dehalobacterium sp.]